MKRPLSPTQEQFVTDTITQDPTTASESANPDPADNPDTADTSASLDSALASSETLLGNPIVAYDPEEDLTVAYENTMVPVSEGQLVTGTVVQVDEDEVLLDIGFKSEGVILSRELSIRRDIEANEIVKVGDVIEASVLHREDREGRLILSKKRAQYERAWGDILAIKEADGTVQGTVIEAVKGGLILDVGLRGFLPASLVDLRRVRDLQPYLGQTLEAKILEIDRTRNNVVLSRREWLQESQREQREQLMGDLKVGEIRTGVVASIVHFGAFIDMGGMDGLVHVSELSWKHVNHPTDVVNVGDEVTVKVLEIDTDRERVSLSMKATQRDPWEEFAETHQEGELVYGRITKTVPFGAFVQVGDVVEGLVHISELASSHVEKAEQVVTPGEELWVKIVAIDLPRRRISLSIKQAAEGGVVAAEYQEHFGEHAYDDDGNYVGFSEDSIASDAEEAWAEYYAEQPTLSESPPTPPDTEFAYEVRDAQPATDETTDAATEETAEVIAEESTEVAAEETTEVAAEESTEVVAEETTEVAAEETTATAEALEPATDEPEDALVDETEAMTSAPKHTQPVSYTHLTLPTNREV